MSDINKDGNLDLDEFIIAMHLIEIGKSGMPLPATLPQELIPPAKRFQQVDTEFKERSDSLNRGRSGSNVSLGEAQKNPGIDFTLVSSSKTTQQLSAQDVFYNA